MKRVALYLRVSTAKQDTDNQRRELEAVAERSGWEVVRIYEDAGISGAKGRDKRPGLDTMMRAVNAKRFDMVAAWSVDRLGRSLTDLLGILQGLQDKQCGCNARTMPRSLQSPWPHHRIASHAGAMGALDRPNDARSRINYIGHMKRDAILTELLELEGMLQDDRLNDHDRLALHGAQQALRNIIEPETWHPAS